jgi:hypothetical protein
VVVRLRMTPPPRARDAWKGRHVEPVSQLICGPKIQGQVSLPTERTGLPLQAERH